MELAAPPALLAREADYEFPLPLGSAAESVGVLLGDGRRVTIRPICPSDLDALRRFFAALSPATLRLRFHISVTAPPEIVLRQFTEIDRRAHVALIGEIHDTAANQSATIVAEARYIRCKNSGDAEFALTVADDWCRVGLGTSITQILARHARSAGACRLSGDVLADNEAMRSFGRALHARVSRGTGGAGFVRLSLETNTLDGFESKAAFDKLETLKPRAADGAHFQWRGC
jgi:hypothetical protein